MYTVIDLFAGAGGLSLGFMQTRKYDIKVAFEKNPHMQDTYRRNHPHVEIQGDVCTADYADIKRRYGDIDVVIGGPPCQGFSNANRQRNTAINQNNILVKQYLRAILELQPKAFVMENVSMLRSDVHRFFMERKDVAIVERCGIPVKTTILHLLDEEFVFEGALELIQDKSRIAMLLWPEAHYAALNVIYKASKNLDKLTEALKKHRKKLEKIAEVHQETAAADHIKVEAQKAFDAIKCYYAGQLDVTAIIALIEPSIMIQRMLRKAMEIHENNILVDAYAKTNGITACIRSFAVFDYIRGILEAPENNYILDSNVLCAADFGAPQKRMRFVIMGIKKDITTRVKLPIGSFAGKKYRSVREAIEDLEDVAPAFDLADDDAGIILEAKKGLSDLAQALRDSAVLRNHIVTKTTDTAMERFRVLKQGENFHSLDERLKTNTYTDASRTQNTIYLRLNYDEPSGTVVNVRKSMWIHPTRDRAISIREAARLQTFPDSFVFCGSKDKQYQQVGNAVPPIMAKSIAKKLAQILTDNLYPN